MSQTIYLLIRSSYEDTTFLASFGVLNGKNQKLYENFFSNLFNCVPNIKNIELIISVDFELALINALKIILPKAIIIGIF
jgi:hypothetical protein